MNGRQVWRIVLVDIVQLEGLHSSDDLFQLFEFFWVSFLQPAHCHYLELTCSVTSVTFGSVQTNHVQAAFEKEKDLELRLLHHLWVDRWLQRSHFSLGTVMA